MTSTKRSDEFIKLSFINYIKYTRTWNYPIQSQEHLNFVSMEQLFDSIDFSRWDKWHLFTSSKEGEGNFKTSMVCRNISVSTVFTCRRHTCTDYVSIVVRFKCKTYNLAWSWRYCCRRSVGQIPNPYLTINNQNS